MNKSLPGGGGNIGGITPGGRAGIGGGRTGVLLFSDIVRLFVVVVSAAPAMSPDTVCEFPAAMSSFNLARSFLATVERNYLVNLTVSWIIP